MKQRGRYSGYEPLHTIPNYQMKYSSKEAYNMEDRPKHTSPCMDPYWRSQPIRQGKVREEHDFDLTLIEED
jgi:hypothetical protein